MLRIALALVVLVPAPEEILRKGHRVAVVGDSITEQKLYSRYLELYLLACVPQLDLKVIQLGWGGETAPGFAARMGNDLLPWKPDVVTTCYGMNDGGYRPYDESIGKRYADAMASIVDRLKKSGATVVVGGPGAVDLHFFKTGSAKPEVYNRNLAALTGKAKEIAAAAGMPFADVHGAMMSAQEKAKAALGPQYDVCGKDGFHPGPNGHLLMAYAFLKGLGLDGEIGTLTVDLKGAAAASDGHRVLGGEGGRVELESSRYPFCTSGDEKSSGGTRSIAAFVPFHQDLNRLTLVVRNLAAARAKVTWGAASKSFTKEDLEKGINLAAEFPENPFSESFRRIEAMVAAKQAFETSIVKQTINGFPRLEAAMGKDPQVTASLEALRKQAYETHEKLHASIRAALLPVRHAIAVEPE
jgi:lysophospholipase L1-like esterase